MGAYTTVAGWIELGYSLTTEEIAGCIETTGEDVARLLDDEQKALYRGGWMIQPEAINGPRFVFFGASIRTAAIPYIRSQVMALSRLVTYDDDYAIHPSGRFLLTEDGTHGTPDMEWIIEEGHISERLK